MGEANAYSGVNSRQYYRVEYPYGERPVFRAEGRLHKAVNVSEKGGRFTRSGLEGTLLGRKIKGTLELRCGDAVEVEGEVIREVEDDFVVLFLKGVPFASITREQRYLIGRFKHVR